VILDTNALSAFADEHPAILTILAQVEQLAIPVIVLGEYRYGIAQSRHKTRYLSWLDGLLADCTVLDVTEKTTLHYADISIELRGAGTPIPTNDLWIAALCRQHRLSVLSRDHHFDLVSGNQRLDWE
jgi:predicted nucleic acid-binding protein